MNEAGIAYYEDPGAVSFAMDGGGTKLFILEDKDFEIALTIARRISDLNLTDPEPARNWTYKYDRLILAGCVALIIWMLVVGWINASGAGG